MSDKVNTFRSASTKNGTVTSAAMKGSADFKTTGYNPKTFNNFMKESLVNGSLKKNAD